MREVSRVPEHVRMARECHLRGLTQALDHPAEPHGTHWGFPVRAYWGFPLRPSDRPLAGVVNDVLPS
jgi:hypothetical protein